MAHPSGTPSTPSALVKWHNKDLLLLTSPVSRFAKGRNGPGAAPAPGRAALTGGAPHLKGGAGQGGGAVAECDRAQRSAVVEKGDTPRRGASRRADGGGEGDRLAVAGRVL